MSPSTSGWRWVGGIALVAVIGIPLMLAGRFETATPAMNGGAPPAAATEAPATTLWDAILQHTQVAEGFGPGADSRYRASLARLRPQAEAVTAVILDHFPRLPPEAHELRFSLVFLLVELGHPHGEPLLTRLVAAKDPPTHEPHPHHTAMPPAKGLRLTAIDGLHKLVGAGSRGARQALFGALDHPDVSTRLAAARTLFHGYPNDSEIQAELRVRVRPDERFTIDGSEKVLRLPSGS